MDPVGIVRDDNFGTWLKCGNWIRLEFRTIAEALGKPVQSIRGKLLSMQLKAPQRDKKVARSDSYEGIEDLATKMTVAQLAEHYGKTERGVKTVLSRRGLSATDYTPKAAKE